MKNKKSILKLIIVMTLFIIIVLAYIARSKYETRQITLQSLPFSFSDIMINDTSDKLHDIYDNVRDEGELPYYTESLEFTCNQYYNRFSLLKENDTTVYYYFYADKLIKKVYHIRNGGMLLDYITAKLTEEFSQPEAPNNVEPPHLVSSSEISLGQSKPLGPIIQTQYTCDMDDYIIDVSTESYKGRRIRSVDLQISFTIKENELVKLANTELDARLSDIDNLRFDKICSFYNGYSIGNIVGNWALINQNNSEVCVYMDFDVHDYSYAHYGLLILRSKRIDSSKKHSYRFVDFSGKTLIDNVSHYKISRDGNTIVVVSNIQKDNNKHIKNDIIFIDNGTYNVVSTDFESIGYFSDDGYALAYSRYDNELSYKLIDRQGKVIHEYIGKSIHGYYNGSTLIKIDKNNGEGYYVLGDKYGNRLTKNENKGSPDASYNIEIFEKYGLLITHFYQGGKPTEIIIENSNGDIIYRDATIPSALEVLPGVIRIYDNNKETYYDHKGTLIDGVTHYIKIPTPYNPIFRNTHSSYEEVSKEHIVRIYTKTDNAWLNSQNDFYYTLLKTQKGDRLYSYNDLLFVFPEEYTLDTFRYFYDVDNILFVARNIKLEKSGVVDIKGNIIFDFKYDFIYSIVAPNIIHVGDDLIDTNGNRVSGGLKVIEYKYNSAIIEDSQGFYVLDLFGKPIIKNVKVIE